MAPQDIDLAMVKTRSEATVLQAGGRVCDWLPYIDRQEPRDQNDLIGRALILNALINIPFGAPVQVIRDWINANKLATYLSPSERALLQKRNEDLSEQDAANLKWSIEALWALIWAGELVADLPIDTHVPDTMAAMIPNLQRNEGGEKFSQRMHLRPFAELYQMLDLYYRTHWFTEDGRINGYETGAISGDIVMERRKALEWLLDASVDWDDISLDT
jgi:hypothetical protein